MRPVTGELALGNRRLSPWPIELVKITWLAAPGQPPGPIVTCHLRCFVFEFVTTVALMVHLESDCQIGGYHDPRAMELVDRALPDICQAAREALATYAS